MSAWGSGLEWVKNKNRSGKTPNLILGAKLTLSLKYRYIWAKHRLLAYQFLL
jgi:hypothetical protein